MKKIIYLYISPKRRAQYPLLDFVQFNEIFYLDVLMISSVKKYFPWIYRFSNKNYNLLLFSLIFLFAFRPCDCNDVYTGFWKFLFVVFVVFAIFNAEHSKIIRVLVSILAVPAIFFNLLAYFDLSRYVTLWLSFSTLLFLGICTVSIVKDVILKARVTLETLRGAICAYFLVGFVFAYFYLFVETMTPGSILIRGGVHPSFPNFITFLSQMIYFSFVTLLTVGYGDIVAVKSLGQTAVVLEAIFGQLYVSILVARLVAVYSFVQMSSKTHLQK